MDAIIFEVPASYTKEKMQDLPEWSAEAMGAGFLNMMGMRPGGAPRAS